MKLLILIIFINHFIACAWLLEQRGFVFPFGAWARAFSHLRAILNPPTSSKRYLVGCNPPNNESSWLVAEFSVISCDDPVDDLLLYKCPLTGRGLLRPWAFPPATFRPLANYAKQNLARSEPGTRTQTPASRLAVAGTQPPCTGPSHSLRRRPWASSHKTPSKGLPSSPRRA